MSQDDSQSGAHRAAGEPTPEVRLAPGEPALRTIAMPADANPNGDIFGGWLLSQMDLAGAVVAFDRAQGRVATIAIDSMKFLHPVYIGDLVTCHATVEAVGTTSIKVRVDSTTRRRGHSQSVRVTEGIFTYVAIDDAGNKRPVPPLET